MRRLVHKLLILMVLVGGLGLFSSPAAGLNGAAKLPCCSWCLNACDCCEVSPPCGCTTCNNCLRGCNSGC